jgi:peptide deformylase
MVRPIIKDIFFLNQKSEPATKADGQVVQDLLDTLKANEAGCLSLEGVRSTTRYQEIEVEYFDVTWKKQRQKYSGWIAQIIQHECDHLDGIII